MRIDSLANEAAMWTARWADFARSSMTENKPLFDYRKMQAKLARAARMNISGADFLQERVTEEIIARLSATNRNFHHALDVFSIGNHMERQLHAAKPEIEVARLGFDNPEASFHRNGNLELKTDSLDLVVSMFGLHRCNDLPGVLQQIFSALKPDGLFMAVILGEGTLSELRQSLLETETLLSGGAALRVDPFAELRQIGMLLQRAGFALPVVDHDAVKLRYSTITGLLRDLRANGAGASFDGPLIGLPRGTQDALEKRYRESFGEADGKIPVSANIIYMTAWTPHISQQKPLKPGSAQMSLTKVLKS